MKVKDLRTDDPYSKIACRAKLCVQAELQRRLGWVDRVLVLDKATLYIYRTEGDSGSLGGWAIGGVEVYVKKPRRDDRFLVIMKRPDAYNLIISLNSLEEQAAFILALSTSGATIMGIYGILLMIEYRQLQNAMIKSLEDQGLFVESNMCQFRNLKERNFKQQPLSIQQLSARMTEMAWTFPRHSTEESEKSEKHKPTEDRFNNSDTYSKTVEDSNSIRYIGRRLNTYSKLPTKSKMERDLMLNTPNAVIDDKGCDNQRIEQGESRCISKSNESSYSEVSFNPNSCDNKCNKKENVEHKKITRTRNVQVPATNKKIPFAKHLTGRVSKMKELCEKRDEEAKLTSCKKDNCSNTGNKSTNTIIDLIPTNSSQHSTHPDVNKCPETSLLTGTSFFHVNYTSLEDQTEKVDNQEDKNSGTSENITNERTIENIRNKSTSENIRNKGTNENITNESTYETITNKSTSKNIRNKGTNENITNESTYETITNKSTSENIRNKGTNENITNESTYETITNKSTSENIRNKGTNENITNESTSENIRNKGTSENIRNKVTNENITNESTSENIRNKGTYENITNESTSENITKVSRNGKITNESRQDDVKQLIEKTKYDGTNENYEYIEYPQEISHQINVPQTDGRMLAEVILSGIVLVSPRIGYGFEPKKVELKRGRMIVYSATPEKKTKSLYPIENDYSATPIKIDLECVSLVPLIEESSYSFMIKRRNKCIAVMQLPTGAELIKWLHAISDEIISSTPPIKRNSLSLYPTPPPRKQNEHVYSTSKYEGPKKPPCLNQAQQNYVEKDPPILKPVESFFSNHETPGEVKNIKQIEKNSESLFRGIKRRFAIRRLSKDWDKPLEMKELDKGLNEYDGTKAVESRKTSYDLESVHKEFTENTIPKTVVSNEKTSLTKFHLPISNGFSQDTLDEIEKVTNALHMTNICYEGTPSIPDKTNYKVAKDGKSDNCVIKDSKEKNKVFESKKKTNEMSKNYSFYQDLPNDISKSKPAVTVSPLIITINASDVDKISKTSELSNESNEITENKGTIDASSQSYTTTITNFPSRPNKYSDILGSLCTNDIPEILVAKPSDYQAEKTSQDEIYNPVSTVRNKVGMSEDSKINGNAGDKVENKFIKVTWSVSSIRERYEILNAVNKASDNPICGPFSRENSINRKKQIRDSIRKKKTFEVESRRASIRNSKRSFSRRPINSTEHKGNQLTIPDIETQNKSNSTLITTAVNKINTQSSNLSSNFVRSYSFIPRRSVIVSKDLKFDKVTGRRSLKVKHSSRKAAEKNIALPTSDAMDETFGSTLLVKGENEPLIYDNMNDIFLAKRQLVSKEIELSRIQNSMFYEEEKIWDIKTKIDLFTKQREEYTRDQVLKSLEEDLRIAKTSYDTLEEQRNEAKLKIQKTKEDMLLSVKRTLE